MQGATGIQAVLRGCGWLAGPKSHTGATMNDNAYLVYEVAFAMSPDMALSVSTLEFTAQSGSPKRSHILTYVDNSRRKLYHSGNTVSIRAKMHLLIPIE